MWQTVTQTYANPVPPSGPITRVLAWWPIRQTCFERRKFLVIMERYKSLCLRLVKLKHRHFHHWVTFIDAYFSKLLLKHLAIERNDLASWTVHHCRGHICYKSFELGVCSAGRHVTSKLSFICKKMSSPRVQKKEDVYRNVGGARICSNSSGDLIGDVLEVCFYLDKIGFKMIFLARIRAVA